MTVSLLAVMAAGIGVALGLLGGGGSILAVPLLVYVAGLPAGTAIATSLLVVGATSAVGVLPHARAGRVHWRTGLVFGPAAMTGAYAGGRAAAYVPGEILLAGFALMMLATAGAMICRRPTGTAGPAPSPARTLVSGVLIGLVAGLIGAGGGFLIVPALTLLGGLSTTDAVGTSLLIIAMQSAAGLAGHLAGAHLPWGLALVVTAAAVAGSLFGARLAGRFRDDVLRTAFGWFVAALGAVVLARQLPAPVIVTVAATAVVLCLRRRPRRAALRTG